MERDAIEDVFSPFGRVSVRRMFSGHGVYVDDACFALVLRGTIWLKADASTKARFVEAGCQPFSYATGKRAVTVDSFWSLPESALDDGDELRVWCAEALGTARKAAAAKAAAKQRSLAKARKAQQAGPAR